MYLVPWQSSSIFPSLPLFCWLRPRVRWGRIGGCWYFFLKKKTLRRTLFLFLCNLHNSCSSVRKMEPGMLLGCHSQNFLPIFLVKLSDVILDRAENPYACHSEKNSTSISFNSNMLNLIRAIRDSRLISNSPQPLEYLHLKLDCLHFPQRRL